MSDAHQYPHGTKRDIDQHGALAWLRGQMWWDRRLADLEAPLLPHLDADNDRPPATEQGRGAA